MSDDKESVYNEKREVKGIKETKYVTKQQK